MTAALRIIRGAKSLINVVYGPRPTVAESADDYPDIVAILDANTRVIAADIQWIIQRRVRAGRSPWEGVYYFRSKAGLISYAPHPIAPELLALPNWFPARGRS